MEILRIENEITDLNEIIYNSEDEDEIQEAKNDIEDLEVQIEEIKENPEGDPSDDTIERKVEEIVDDYMRDPINSLKEFGVDDLTPFVDIDALIEDGLDTDGLGNVLATYDGDEYDVKIGDTYYFVYRTE